MQQFETGIYADRAGRKWWCVADPKRKQMVCDSENGSFTVASFDTFSVWGWRPIQGAIHEQETAR